MLSTIILSRMPASPTTFWIWIMNVYPNIVREFIPTAPNQLWVSDITYITIWLNEYSYIFCYLSLILDSYTEEIVGWSVVPTLETSYPLEWDMH